jgi:hypothetical protein
MGMGMNNIHLGIEKAALLILNSGIVARWVEGSIFPAELAFFLGACQANGIEAIIESGRQDGYSTEILGLWAQMTNVTVASIDTEGEPERAKRCRARLEHLPIKLIKDNACAALGREVGQSAPKATALLIDGPKQFLAIALVAAAADDHVRVFAMHNLIGGRADAEWLRPFKPIFYEEIAGECTPMFNRLREEGIRHCNSLHAARSLERSSLGVFILDDAKRARLRGVIDRKFGLMQPPIIRSLWHVKGYALAPWLYRVSYHLTGG